MSFTNRVVDLIEEGFDLALRIGSAEPDSRLVSRVIARFRARLCAAPSYLARQGKPKRVEDLARHDCLLFSSATRRHHWRFRDDDGAWVKALVRSRLRLDSGEALRNAAVAGEGIALLPDFLIAEDLAAGRLVQVSRTWSSVRRRSWPSIRPGGCWSHASASSSSSWPGSWARRRPPRDSSPARAVVRARAPRQRFLLRHVEPKPGGQLGMKGPGWLGRRLGTARVERRRGGVLELNSHVCRA